MSDATGQGGDSTPRLSAKGVTLTWAALALATILGWVVAQRDAGTSGEAGIVALAGIKIYLIMAVFMGLGNAPPRWHLAAVAWVVVTCGLVLALVTGALA